MPDQVSSIFGIPQGKPLPPAGTVLHELHPRARRESALGGIVDNLEELLNPEVAAELPATLKLKPEQLQRLSVSQAVERAHNARLHKEALDAKKLEEELKANLLQKPYRVYDNGWRWAELPDTVGTPEDLELVKKIGCRGGWCTQDDSYAKFYGDRSEGNQLYTLFDPTGKPHAQIHSKEGEGVKQIKPLENRWHLGRVQEQVKQNPEYRAEITRMLRDFVDNGQWDPAKIDDLPNIGRKRNVETGEILELDEAELRRVYETGEL